MECIKKKSLNAEVRNEIVRDLIMITNMYGYIEKPGAEFSTFAAQKLVLKYPFMRDHSVKALHLMQQTYDGRRQFIYQAKAIGGRNGVLQQFPAFAMPTAESKICLKVNYN